MMDAFSIYKKSRWCYLHHLKLLAVFFKGLNYFLHNSSIPYQAQLGKNCKFLYGGIGVVIHKDSVLGDNVIIGTNVLIGGRSNNPVPPKIGSNVYLATGSKILGNIIIEDNVIVGANAVVIHDVKSNCSVGGVPAHILKEGIDVNDYCSLNRYGKKEG